MADEDSPGEMPGAVDGTGGKQGSAVVSPHSGRRSITRWLRARRIWLEGGRDALRWHPTIGMGERARGALPLSACLLHVPFTPRAYAA